jgi:hypothetical protein
VVDRRPFGLMLMTERRHVVCAVPGVPWSRNVHLRAIRSRLRRPRPGPLRSHWRSSIVAGSGRCEVDSGSGEKPFDEAEPSCWHPDGTGGRMDFRPGRSAASNRSSS